MYVDDFLMAGSLEKLTIGSDLLTNKAKLDLEVVHPVDKCLGCNHHITDDVIDGHPVKRIEFDMTSFMEQCVAS